MFDKQIINNMTKSQFSEALKLAQSGKDLSMFDDLPLFGCGLPDFKPVYCTIGQVARILNYQCAMFNGQWDGEELNNMAHIARRNFLIV